MRTLSTTVLLVQRTSKLLIVITAIDAGYHVISKVIGLDMNGVLLLQNKSFSGGGQVFNQQLLYLT